MMIRKATDDPLGVPISQTETIESMYVLVNKINKLYIIIIIVFTLKYPIKP